jgi:hypothetical protein
MSSGTISDLNSAQLESSAILITADARCLLGHDLNLPCEKCSG